MKNLGVNIKTLRKQNHLTLIEVSKRTGIDAATLSRIENGLMTGTIQSHLSIAKALNVRLPDLYEKVIESEDKAPDAKESPDASGVFAHTGGSTSELMTAQVLSKKMMPVRLTLRPQARTESEELPLGTERFVYVLSGQVSVKVRHESQTLSEGQSLYFNASLPHYFQNKLRLISTCLIVTSPASL